MRPLWSGAISFGLIYIPVKLYPATQSQDLDLDMLSRKDLANIRYARVDKQTGEEVPYDEIVKGYEYSPGNYVVVEEEDFERARGGKAKVIDILSFVNIADIDDKYFEKPFYLEPTENAQQGYALLREALKKTKKAALVKFMVRTREHLGVLKPEDEMILLDQMRFASEIRSIDELELPGNDVVGQRELEMAVRLIDQLTQPWNPEQYRDTYIDELRDLIQKKAEGQKLAPVKEEEIPTEVTDLFARLSESLEQARKKK